MKVVSDHGYPVASDGTDANALDAFKNERDYIAQSGRHKTTVAAMDWALREIERSRAALKLHDDLARADERDGDSEMWTSNYRHACEATRAALTTAQDKRTTYDLRSLENDRGRT